MRRRANLVLCGFMGVGKTSVARALHSLFHYDVVDTDALIQERTGLSPAELLRGPGEPRLREIEREVIREVAGRRATVISTGGGVPLDPENLRRLGETGVLILLEASPATLLRRLSEGGDRPLVEGADLGVIEAKLGARRHAYGRIPHRVLTDGREVEDVAREAHGLYLRHARR